MKQIKDKWMKFYSGLLGSFLAFLGFSSCDKIPFFDDIGGGAVCMYGTPTAEYKFKGTVKDEAGKPIESAEVIIRNLGYKGDYLMEDRLGDDFYKAEWLNDTIKVDKSGIFDISLTDVVGGDNDFRIVAKDVAHEADSVEFTLKTSGGDGAWDQGSAEKTVNFTLKKADGQN